MTKPEKTAYSESVGLPGEQQRDELAEALKAAISGMSLAPLTI